MMGAESLTGGDFWTSSKFISWAGPVWSERESPLSMMSVSVTVAGLTASGAPPDGTTTSAAAWLLRGCCGGFTTPFPVAAVAGLAALSGVGEASSILLVSLPSAGSLSSLPMDPSVRESSSRSRASCPPSSSPSSSTLRRWPMNFLRRVDGAVAAAAIMCIVRSGRRRLWRLGGREGGREVLLRPGGTGEEGEEEAAVPPVQRCHTVACVGRAKLLSSGRYFPQMVSGREGEKR